jgi:hypothetical protein
MSPNSTVAEVYPRHWVPFLSQFATRRPLQASPIITTTTTIIIINNEDEGDDLNNNNNNCE